MNITPPPLLATVDTSQEHGDVVDGRDNLRGQGSPVSGLWDGVPPPHPPRTSSSNRIPPRRVDHTYRDYSHFPAGDLQASRRKKSGTNFPTKLHLILCTDEFAHIISWMPHGRCWKIHDKDLLMREVVPRYFAQSKYESFTRQLNGWGFKRLHQSGNDFDAYYHECFLRGLPHLTVLMKRVPRNQGKMIPYVEGEPNFYEINQQFPLPPLIISPLPTMPYQGQCPHSASHMTEAGVGYDSSPTHYAPHPSNYPPPPPQYYSGYPDDPRAAATFAPQLGYPPPPFYTHQPAYHPHYPGRSPSGTRFHFDNSPLNHVPGLAKNEGAHLAAFPQAEVLKERVPAMNGTVGMHSHHDHNPDPCSPPWGARQGDIQGEISPFKEEGREDCFDSWSIFGESKNTTATTKIR